MNRRRFLAAAAGLAATACGGGGGGSGPSASGPITPAPAIRKDLDFGYFYGTGNTVHQVANHSTLFWAAYTTVLNSELNPAKPPGAVLDQLAAVTQASAAGYRSIVLEIPGYPNDPDPEGVIRRHLDWHASAGVLGRVKCLYPADEPNSPHSSTGVLTDAAVNARNDLIRKIARDYPGLENVALGVFWSVGDAGRPGLASYDWGGLSAFDYGNRQGDLLDDLVDQARKAGNAMRSMPIAYGATPWSIDPAGLEAYAHSRSHAVALIAFLWQTVTDRGSTYAGISTQAALRALYVAAGMKVKA